MLANVLVFLLIAAAFVMATSCSTKAPVKTGDSAWSKIPAWPENANWLGIKALWLEWFVRCQKIEAPRRKTIYSTRRTIALCAAICLAGAILKLEHDEPGAVSRIGSGYMHTFLAAVQHIPSPTTRRY